MAKTEFTIPSSDGIHHLHCILWTPEGAVKRVLQIVHGMAEYADRYDEFARFMNENGVAVVAHDHLGHGQSVNSTEELGFFAEKNGADIVLKDVRAVGQHARGLFPDAPFFLMGHSMGSFFARRYITKYRDIAGAIFSGTGDVPGAAASFGRVVAGLMESKKRSGFLYAITLGGYNKPFAPARTENDWLSKNEANVDRYNAAPLCGFRFTASAYRDFFTVLASLARGEDFENIDRGLPILFFSGEMDPVGGCGKAVPALARKYRELGVRDVTAVLYPGDRHETLNEDDRETVFADVLRWMEAR